MEAGGHTYKQPGVLDDLVQASVQANSSQYNTCFWLLVKSGLSKQDAFRTLQVCA